MSPKVFPISGWHKVEISKFEACPLDQNTRQKLDPRYQPLLGEDSWLTEWDILDSNGVAEMLYYLPAYDYYVRD